MGRGLSPLQRRILDETTKTDRQEKTTLRPLEPVEEEAEEGTDGAAQHDPGGVDDAQKKSASTVLVELAKERFYFGVSDGGEPFAVPRSGPKVVSMLRGGKTSLRSLLAREYFQATGKAPPQQALADALLVLDGIAQDEEESVLHTRVAQHGGALWLDLGDQTGRAVAITTQGWTVQAEAPIFFRRSALTSPLPEPMPGGDLEQLWSWLNVSAEDRPLVLAWLLSTLYPNIPHPVLNLSGEQGSGKTTAQRVLVSLIDPSPVPTRKPPRDAEAWVTAASGSWVVGLDNLTNISDWLSDSLCRAVTGDGDVRRRLYSDGNLYVFAFRRAIILTGIDLGALNGDLADRVLPVHLDIIPSDERREESEMWPAWEQAHPQILGALLAGLAGLAGVLPFVRLGAKPRMADFARVVAAVDDMHGTTGLQRYLDKQGALASESLTDDLFITMMEKSLITTFEGTSAELLARVPAPERVPKDWPSNARSLTQHLHRQAPVMRKAGWTVENDGGSNKRGVVRWTVTPPEKVCTPDPLSPPSPPEQVRSPIRGGSMAGQAGQAGHEAGHPRLRAPGLSREGGEAGKAGPEYEPSLDGDAEPSDVPTLDAACPVCGAPPPRQSVFGWAACEHQIAAGLVSE